MKKPIIFVDFDGTICMDRYGGGLTDIEREKVQNVLLGTDRTKMNDWLRGKYTAEEINRYISEQTKIDYEYLWNVFVTDCKNMKVSKNVLETLNSLRKKYVVILMTGNTDSFARFTVPSLNLEKYFDLISNSYYEQKHKLDDGGSLFLKYSEKYEVDISSCFLLDDNLKVCEVFRNLGGNVLHVTKEKPVEIYLEELI